MTLYWRLSGFYFFYFASIGSLIPYLGIYLNSHDYSPQQISMVFAAIMGTKIVAPNVWGWIADHTGKRMKIVRVASVLSLFCFVGIFVSQEYHWLLLVMIVFSFFWNANLPQFEAVTLSHLGKETHKYSSIRLWGSLGFVLLVMLLGAFFEYYSVELLPVVLMFLLAGILFFSFLVPEYSYHHEQDGENEFKKKLFSPEVLMFFLICFLLQASHGPYYAFYSVYLEQNGYSRTLIGQLWALGVIAEILIFLVMHRLMPLFGPFRLLIICLLLTSLRWFLIAVYVDSFAVILFAQSLHAASFGIFHAVAIHQIHRYFPGKMQGRGQALYSSISFGAGGAIGAIYSGWVWEGYGAAWVYSVAGVIGVAALICAFIYKGMNKDSQAGNY